MKRLVVLVLIIGLFLAACGDSDTPGDATPETVEQATAEFRTPLPEAAEAKVISTNTPVPPPPTPTSLPTDTPLPEPTAAATAAESKFLVRAMTASFCGLKVANRTGPNANISLPENATIKLRFWENFFPCRLLPSCDAATGRPKGSLYLAPRLVARVAASDAIEVPL